MAFSRDDDRETGESFPFIFSRKMDRHTESTRVLLKELQVDRISICVLLKGALLRSARAHSSLPHANALGESAIGLVHYFYT